MARRHKKKFVFTAARRRAALRNAAKGRAALRKRHARHRRSR